MLSNGAPSAERKNGDGGANRDGGRDRAMSRGGMSCDGATSLGKASNGRTMTGGMMSGAVTTTVGAEASASATGTIGAMTVTGPIPGLTDAARGSLSTAIAGWVRRSSTSYDAMSGRAATHECAMIVPPLAACTIGATIGTTIPGATMTGATAG